MMKPPLKEGDYHLYTNGKDNTSKLFHFVGGKGVPVKVNGRYEFPSFPHGIAGPNQQVNSGDTTESLYKLGKPIYTQAHESDETKRAYGRVFIPMHDVEGKALAAGRDGFGNHGGGKWGSHYDDFQPLVPTRGCVRGHNKDVESLAWIWEQAHKTGNTVWQSVDQPGGGGQV